MTLSLFTCFYLTYDILVHHSHGNLPASYASTNSEIITLPTAELVALYFFLVALSVVIPALIYMGRYE